MASLRNMYGWGVGPRISIPGYAALALLWPVPASGIARPLGLSTAHTAVPAYVLIGIGVLLLVITNIEMMRARRRGDLVTGRLYALTRNPMYGAHIFFVMPGFCLLADNTATLLSVACAVALFYVFIREEERQLEERFGEQYAAYRMRVGRLVPGTGGR